MCISRGTFLVYVVSNERLYALQDANWNVTSYVNESGIIQERYIYNAYGSATLLDSNFNVISSTTIEPDNLYAGYNFDADVEMYHVRNRVYHPMLGTWLQRDPIGYDSGLNLYEFLGSNTYSHLDPFGLQLLVCDKKTCEECYKKALKEDPILQELKKIGGKKKLTLPGYSKGCKPNVSCVKCGVGVTHAWDPGPKTIRICHNKAYQKASKKPSQCDHITEILRHEYIHQINYCKRKNYGGDRKPKSLQDCTTDEISQDCTTDEISAYRTSGMCKPGSAWWQIMGPFANEKACLLEGVRLSCAGFSFLAPQIQQLYFNQAKDPYGDLTKKRKGK